MRHAIHALAILFFGVSAAKADDLPAAIAAPSLKVIITVQAEGVQVYDCKASGGGQTTWQFREPIAALFEGGKNVGTHFAGPSWKIGDSTIRGKVAAKSPGASDKDIPWLKLDVVSETGEGPLSHVTTVQRIHTLGGNLTGNCDRSGDQRQVPYTADYVFLKP